MDKGVKFVLDNYYKSLDLIDKYPEFSKYKRKVQSELNRIKYIKYTGNMYEHFLKFKDGNHKFAKDFKFLEDNGLLSNESMADYLKEHFPEEINNYSGIEDLIIGNVYSNNEIANTFKCSNMGGMRKSNLTNSLVLIAKHNNPLYDDHWNGNILNYTGMGTVGDQSISYSQNKTLATSQSTGVKVYLFESYEDNEYLYNGEVVLAGSIFQADEVDAEGNLRKVVKFPLKRKDENANVLVDIESIEKSVKEKIKEVKKHSLDEIKEKAKSYNSDEVCVKEVKSVYRDRNQYVAQYTKNRAKGICDLCGEEAPFKDKNGNPYLESHHVITLADGGPDKIYNTVAICPNCHRKIHVLNSKDDLLKLQKVILKYLLADDDNDNVINWKELFK